MEASRLLRQRHPEIVVVLLSSYDEAEFADMISDCGATAYVANAGRDSAAIIAPPRHDAPIARMRGVTRTAPVTASG